MTFSELTKWTKSLLIWSISSKFPLNWASVIEQIIFLFYFFRNVKLEETYFDRKLEQALMKSSQAAFMKKTQPTLTVANVIGNMYTPSLYGGLISLLIK